jgi:TatD DNase family protein
MRIDTHTHIKSLDGLDKIIVASADPKNIDDVFNAAQENPNIFCSIGIHPEYLCELPDYFNLLSNPKVVAVGEIGLDYHYDIEHKNEQIAMFEKQLEIARRAKLPVMVHSREAEQDSMNLLNDVSGVLHCFTSSYNFAKTMLDRGFYISASGIITFKNSQELRETFEKIPLDMIVAETDSPYCAPVPFRGKECTPSMVFETIKCLADIKKIPVVEMDDILWNNAHRLYPKLNQPK